MVIPNSMSQVPSQYILGGQRWCAGVNTSKTLANTQNQRFVWLGTDGTIKRTMNSFSARSVRKVGTGHARTFLCFSPICNSRPKLKPHLSSKNIKFSALFRHKTKFLPTISWMWEQNNVAATNITKELGKVLNLAKYWTWSFTRSTVLLCTANKLL